MFDDYLWFEDNYTELQSQYGDAFLAIKNKSVIGVYENYADGVKETLKTDQIGSFIVQRCTKEGGIFECRITSMNFM